MISPEIKDAGAVILYHLQNPVEKAGVLSLPASGFFELPSVDDVSVEDEVFTSVLFQEPGDFLGLGAFGA